MRNREGHLLLGWRALLLLTAVLLVVAAAEAEEEDLYADLAWASDDKTRYTYRRAAIKDTRPSDVPAVDFKGDIHFVDVSFHEDQDLLIAVDLTPEQRRMWIDQDFDRNLGDEKVIPMRSGSNRNVREVIAHLPIELEPGDSTMVRVDLWLLAQHGETPWMGIRVRLHREGAVVMAGRHRKIVLLDGEGDLRFDEAGIDELYVDLDGDGQVDTGPESRDHVGIDQAFRARDRGYIARVVDKRGGEVAFFPLDEVPPVASAAWRPQPVPARGATLLPNPSAFAGAKSRYERAIKSKYPPSGPRLASLIRAIGDAGTDEAFKYLLRIYRAQKGAIARKAILAAMGHACYADFEGKLIALVRAARDADVATAGMQALHRMDAPSRVQLLAALLKRTRDERVFDAAAKHLAYVRSGAAQAVLEDALERATKPERLATLYRAARHFGPRPPSEEQVRAAVGSPKERLRALGLEDAARTGMLVPPTLALKVARQGASDGALCATLLEILGQWGDAASVAAALPLAEHAAPEARADFVTRLASVRDTAVVGVLVHGLEASEPAVRATAAEAVAAMPGPAIAPALTERLVKEHDRAVLGALVRALASQGGEDGVPAIVSVARRHRTDPELQEAILKTLARIGFGHAQTVRLFTERLRTTKGDEKLALIDIAAGSGHPGAAGVLLEMFEAKEWKVRVATAQAFGRLRVKEAIVPLIDVLEAEKDARVRRALGQSLFFTTGQYLYDDVAMWRRWWKEHGETFAVSAEKPKLPENPTARPYATTFYGVPVETERQRLIFVLDQSGSMGGSSFMRQGGAGKTELQKAVAETLKVVSKLKNRSRVNVICFESSIHPWSRKLVPLTKKTRANLKAWLLNREPMGGTNLYDGLEEALKTTGVDAIYLLSDGMPGSGKYVETEDILREVRKLNRSRRIPIHCVALGFFRADLLKRLAEESGGNYVERK